MVGDVTTLTLVNKSRAVSTRGVDTSSTLTLVNESHAVSTRGVDMSSSFSRSFSFPISQLSKSQISRSITILSTVFLKRSFFLFSCIHSTPVCHNFNLNIEQYNTPKPKHTCLLFFPSLNLSEKTRKTWKRHRIMVLSH